MNKILMDKKVFNVSEENKKITLDNEHIVLNIFSEDSNGININFELNNNSILEINYALISKKNNKVNVKGIIKGNNNKCIIKIRSIASINELKIDVNVNTSDKTINNEIVEDIKSINEDGQTIILPILEVETNEVNASHFATIGSYNEEELFYLKSKGLNEKNAKNILKASFLKSIFDKDFNEKMKGSDFDE